MIKSPTREIAETLKEVEELMIPPDGAMRKLGGVVNSVLPDEGCEVLGEELTVKGLPIVLMASFY